MNICYTERKNKPENVNLQPWQTLDFTRWTYLFLSIHFCGISSAYWLDISQQRQFLLHASCFPCLPQPEIHFVQGKYRHILTIWPWHADFCFRKPKEQCFLYFPTLTYNKADQIEILHLRREIPTGTYSTINTMHACSPTLYAIKYRKISYIRRVLVGNKIVDHSDVVGASPVGAAPTTSSFSTWHLASRDSTKTATRQYENLLSVGI